jgi:hypothetical protein
MLDAARQWKRRQEEGPFARIDQRFADFLKDLATQRSDRWMPARNFLLDEGIVAARGESYRSSGGAAGHVNGAAWQSAHAGYLEQRVFLEPPADDTAPKEMEQADEDLCPETFRHLDHGSPFLHSDASLHLLRTEEISFIADRSGYSASRLKGLAEDVMVHGPRAPGFADLDSALRRWSKRTDLRPVFAAFWEDLKDLFGSTPAEDRPGWADGLRNRVGLAHLDPGGRGSPIDVFVFRYPVGELARIIEFDPAQRALVAPTVLDGRFSDAFCPAPAGQSTGHTLDLGGSHPGPRREVLHPKLAFGAQHLWRVGTITTPFDTAGLDTLRGLHLVWLQGETGRTDYARNTDGDLL